MNATTTNSEALRAMARRCAELRQQLTWAHETIGEHWDHQAKSDHARHGAWRRWRISRRLLGKAYQLGLIAGWGVQGNRYCRSCVDHIGWRGRRLYVLGLSREQWSCLILGRHRRRELPEAPYLCAVCAPCPTCESSDPKHGAWVCMKDAEQRAVTS